MPEVSMDSLVGKQLPDISGTLTSMRSFGDPSKERKYQQSGNQLDFFVLMASARMGPLTYPGPEANRWLGMLLSLTLMQTHINSTSTTAGAAANHAATAKSAYVHSHFCTVCH